MWNPPTEKQLLALPRMGSTERVSLDEKRVLMHFFMGGSDWYVAEYSPDERMFFGYAVLNGDWGMAEWGYISLDELKELRVGGVEVDRDLHWKHKKFKEVLSERGR